MAFNMFFFPLFSCNYRFVTHKIVMLFKYRDKGLSENTKNIQIANSVWWLHNSLLDLNRVIDYGQSVRR